MSELDTFDIAVARMLYNIKTNKLMPKKNGKYWKICHCLNKQKNYNMPKKKYCKICGFIFNNNTEKQLHICINLCNCVNK